MRLFETLKEILMAGTLFREANRLWKEEKDESYEEGYKEAITAVREELTQVLKTRYGKDNGEAATEEEWRDAENVIKNKK